jgi:hypothetical protein
MADDPATGPDSADGAMAPPGKIVEAPQDAGEPTAEQVALRDAAFARANRTGPTPVAVPDSLPQPRGPEGPPAPPPSDAPSAPPAAQPPHCTG